MSKHIEMLLRPSRLFTACLMLASTLAAATVPATTVGAVVAWDNTADRSAVIESYDAEFAKQVPDIGWNGDRGTCNAGSTSQAYRDAIFDRINWFRGMAGVPTGVTENTSYSAKAQDAALMMSVTGRLSHSPDGSFGCSTSDGVTAAGSSNLYLGRTGPNAISGYMFDPGDNNVSVGHRNWILHPTVSQMGTGDIPSAGGWASNVLWVFDNVFGPQPTLRESEGFIAWPPRGYVPSEVVYPRWSFSIRGADFNSASISMSEVAPDGGLTSVGNSVVHRSNSGGAPFSIIVWEPTGIETAPPLDLTYRVTVSGAVVNGATKNFSYDVTVIGEQPVNRIVLDYSGYINAAYEDFLGRAPSAAELESCGAELNSGTTPFAFVLALAESDEWSTHVVDQMYLDTLGRPADEAGKAYWVFQLQNGFSVAEIAGQFYGSPEYVANEGNQYDLWLEDLYAELLGRNPDGAGLDYWLSQTNALGSTNVAFTFYQSEESRMARVAGLFQTLLGRAPGPEGHSYWAEVLLNGDDIALAANLASSDEYLNRSSTPG